MSKRSCSSGQKRTTVSRYGQYLQTTSEQKNFTVCEANCFWRYNGYVNISPRNIFSPLSKTPWWQTATSTPSSSNLVSHLVWLSHACSQQMRTLQHPGPETHQKIHQVLKKKLGRIKITITVALWNLYGKEYYTPRLALKAVKFMISIHCNSQHGGCPCRTLKMLHLRQTFHFKFGIDPFQKWLLHSIHTYLATLKAKRKSKAMMKL